MNVRPDHHGFELSLRGMKTVELSKLRRLFESNILTEVELGSQNMILDITDVRVMDGETRSWLNKKLTETGVGRIAILAEGPIPSLIAGFLETNIHRTVPMRRFSSSEEAEYWFRSTMEN